MQSFPYKNGGSLRVSTNAETIYWQEAAPVLRKLASWIVVTVAFVLRLRLVIPTGMLALLFGASTLITPSVSVAHVVLDQRVAPAGSYYRGAFRVGHGCDGSATIAITVTLPEGVRGAKPMPKPGWTVERRVEKLARPYDSQGKSVTDDVVSITWRGGPLPDYLYDEFVMQMQLPATTGPIWFKVLQQCEKGENDWATIPVNGTSTRGIKTPAALLELSPTTNAAPAPSSAVSPSSGTGPKAGDEHKH